MKCLLTVLILLANMAVQAQTKETCRVAWYKHILHGEMLMQTLKLFRSG